VAAAAAAAAAAALILPAAVAAVAEDARSLRIKVATFSASVTFSMMLSVNCLYSLSLTGRCSAASQEKPHHHRTAVRILAELQLSGVQHGMHQ
jgi:hypothetical protein